MGECRSGTSDPLECLLAPLHQERATDQETQGKRQARQQQGLWKRMVKHTFANTSHISLHQSGPMMIKISAAPTHVGLGLRGQLRAAYLALHERLP